ncbi:GNAT family N-acetyltransferase [Aquisalimonas lutea]|uniref:GNAT family N-acetyltransferase n=1 Tax=Aquisalimonas lutea TaxID=1327750 RepID=UPI0025B2CAB0|nr:GNAT family N-acetyltransferase [Aquisalimonas lutea]MDN3516278.1 GNAT family N-acetyltransferase [Aquisalimonas lutea]
MTNDTAYAVRNASWPDDLAAIRSVRGPVFVDEQRVPVELEWDEVDATCVHVLAESPDDGPIGTGRLAPDGKIGRIAVLPGWRHRGVGDAILQALIDEALASGLSECRLHAQATALDFYARRGFTAEGPEFQEAGITHRLMRRRFGPVTAPRDRAER